MVGINDVEGLQVSQACGVKESAVVLRLVGYFELAVPERREFDIALGWAGSLVIICEWRNGFYLLITIRG